MCNLSVSSDITLIAAISTAIEDATICVGSDYTITATSSPGITGYTWSNGATGQSITVNQGGTYTVTATSACGTSSDDAIITEELGIDKEELGGSAWEAATASFILFSIGFISFVFFFKLSYIINSKF
jgi:hypothetical protein